MLPFATPFLASRWPRTTLTGAAGAVAILALLGTLTGSTGLATFGSGLVPMSPIIVGLLLLLVGALLLREVRPESRQLRRLAILLAMTVAWLCLGLLAGHATGDPWLERVLVLGRPQVQYTSVLTVIALLGAALSALVRWWPLAPTWRDRQGAALLALATLVISSAVLISYLAGAPLLYGSDRIPMALPSALCSWLLGCSLWLAAGSDTWPLAALARTIEKRRGLAAGFSLQVTSIFLVAVVLVIAGGSLFLRVQIQRTQTSVQRDLLTVADFKAHQIATWWGERQGDAAGVLHARLIQNQLRMYLKGPESPTSAADVRAWMEELQKDQYHRVVLFDGQGRLRLSAQSAGTAPEEPMDPAEIQAALRSREVVVRDLHQNPERDDIYLSLWVPIGARAGGRAEGVLLLMLDPRAFLFPLLQNWPTASPSAETLLVRREGSDILYLNELRHRSGTAMRLRLPMASDPKTPSIRSTVGRGGLVEGLDYRGVRVLAVLRRIPDTNWSVVAKVDSAEVYGPLRRMVWTTGLALLGLLGLFGAGLMLFLWHHDKDMLRRQLHLSERFETLMNEANDIILVLDGEGHVREANARAVEQYGYALEELHGMGIAELRAPGCRGEAKGVFEQVKVAGSGRFETIHCRKDGGTFPVEVSTRALTLAGEQRVISFVHDITERRAQEHELQRMTRLYAALSQVNQAIVKSTTRQELFDKVCEVLVEFGSFSVAWIGWNDSQSHLVTAIARYGDTTDYLDRIRVESGDSTLAQGPTGTAIREGCPCVVNAFHTTPGTEAWRDAAAASGFQASAAFPIRLGGEVVGALTVHAKERDFFGAHEVELLVEAAGDLSFGLDHLAGEARRSEAEAALIETERFLMEAQSAGEIGTFTWLIPEDRWQGSPYLDQIFGVGPEQPRNLSGWLAIVAPDFRAKLESYVAGIIEAHEPFDLDYPIVRVADGAFRWVHGRGDIRRDADDQPTAMVGTIQDITERKQTERTLTTIRMAVEQSPVSILITDAQGNIEYVNPAFTEVTGYTAAEALGQNPRILKSPNTAAEQYQDMWETLVRGDVWKGQLENRKKDGSLFYERATMAPVWDEDGVVTHYVALKEDITQARQEKAERRALEAQLHQSQKLESLGSLAGGVAHDMNNVLGAILVLASTLREAEDPAAPAVKKLDTIVNACLRGRGVVKGLLYFARKDLEEEGPIDLNALVQEMSQLLSYTTLKRVELRMELAPGLSLVRGDAGALSHALMNLCVNAMDAMPKGGILHIQTAATTEGGVELRVKDTGEGMAPDVLAKAMEPFFTTKPVGKGTGLGLAMVYGTMVAHNGTFGLRSQLGVGTEAILGFPASRAEAAVAVAALIPSVAKAPQPSLGILLVDDDELIRESVGPMLEMLGHKVTTAAGGAEALRLLEGGLPLDLVILDMNMPGMNGAEALPLVLQLRPALHVLMASGYSDHDIAPLLEGRPRVASIRKPFSLKEVQAKLAELGIPMGSSDPSWNPGDS
jgi:PAS domain S-box-containing protein